MQEPLFPLSAKISQKVARCSDKFVFRAPQEPLPAHIEEGRRGEEVALFYLARQGYQIKARNVRFGKDEIDIVAFDPRDCVLVFVEVKTRSRFKSDYHPVLNVTRWKRVAMSRAARRYVHEKKWDAGYRLDVVCVIDGRVTQHDCEVAWK